MKIGIYTLFRRNYGAVLQAYSLRRTIKKMSPEDEVLMVDFKTSYHQSRERIFSLKSNNRLYNIIWQAHILIRYRQLKRKKDAFEEFHNTQFEYTSRYSSQTELLNNPPRLDVHLSGSDQVFNPNNKYRDIYYLRFEKGTSKKIAYAPSFGIHVFSNEDRNYIKSSLIDFDYLSCREIDGARFLTELLGKEIPQVLDPVFLTPAREWKQIEIVPDLKPGYLFIYCLKDSRFLIQFAKTNYPDYKIVALTPNDLRFYPRCEQLYYPGPREFVGLISHADVVVTDSFHGTAFSIIFNKNFYTFISRPNVSSRIVSLLNILGLEDRIVTIGGTVSNKHIKAVSSCSPVLEQLISSSKLFLSEILQS